MNTTHVFVADTSVLVGDAYRRAYDAVSDARRAAVDRLHSPVAQRASLGAELLLWRAANVLGLPKAPLVLDTNGKPHVKGDPFFFNLSHSGSVAVCAVSDTEVGCDVEHPRDALLKVTERVCGNAEKAFLTSLPPHERLDAALRLWTLKESAVKACGKGLSVGMERFCFSLTNNGATLVTAPVDASWQFREFCLPSGARIAVCAGTTIEDLHIITL